MALLRGKWKWSNPLSNYLLSWFKIRIMRLLFVFVFLLALVSCGEEKSSSSSSSDSSSGGESISVEPEKQPNCDEIDGVLRKPSNFTGIYKHCANGKVIWYKTYKDGKKNGVSKKWHKSTGHQEYTSSFIDNKKEGVWYSWFEDGQKDSVIKYENDKQVDGEGWHTNGILAVSIKTNKDGSKTTKRWLITGKLYQFTVEDKDGKKIKDEYYK